MSEEIEFGLTLMAVGMITVITILGLVVMGGKTMILLINKFSPEVELVKVQSHGTEYISKTKISVLASAVASATEGKGKITNIKKL